MKSNYILIISVNGILNYSFWETETQARMRMKQEYDSFREIQGIEPQDESWIDDRSAYVNVENQFGVSARLSIEIAEIPK